MFNKYSLYSYAANEQNIANEENKTLFALNRLNNFDFDMVQNFVSEYCKDENFEKEFDCENNVKLFISRFDDEESLKISIEAKQFGKRQYCHHWIYEKKAMDSINK